MQSKNIVVLNGHPGQRSLSKSLSEAYAGAARDAGHDLRVHHLSDMVFDMDFGEAGFSETKALEPDLEAFLADLEWADHVVVAAPMWWGSLPAKLKGLFDRALLPGRTFDTRNTSLLALSFDEFAQFDVFEQQITKILGVGVPTAVPGAVHLKAHADRIDFMSH